MMLHDSCALSSTNPQHSVLKSGIGNLGARSMWKPTEVTSVPPHVSLFASPFGPKPYPYPFDAMKQMKCPAAATSAKCHWCYIYILYTINIC